MDFREDEDEQEENTHQELTTGKKEELELVLARFEEVFQEPRGLPPARNTVHQIALKEGADPINVRPYKYPHLMKEEIENYVAKKLKLNLGQRIHTTLPCAKAI